MEEKLFRRNLHKYKELVTVSEQGGGKMDGLSSSFQNVKTSAQLLHLLDGGWKFVWLEDEQKEVKVNLHGWKNYACYEFTHTPRYGICPIENLWEFVKVTNEAVENK